ncbi:MAG: hypothetical protein ACPG4N_02855 [Gammaproteobacteria bacterium]
MSNGSDIGAGMTTSSAAPAHLGHRMEDRASSSEMDHGCCDDGGMSDNCLCACATLTAVMPVQLLNILPRTSAQSVDTPATHTSVTSIPFLRPPII